MSATRAWGELEPMWRACFELAWEAYRAGSVGVGAIVLDTRGEILARGRARSVEIDAPHGQVSNANVAHAEINALAQVPRAASRAEVLYTSLEPCLMCVGAMVIAHVREVRYAGSDVLWHGIERLPELNGFVAERWPVRSGPREDAFGLFAALLPLLFYVERYPTGDTAASHGLAAPELLALAKEIAGSGEHRAWRSLGVGGALQLVWPRLVAIARSPAPAGSE